MLNADVDAAAEGLQLQPAFVLVVRCKAIHKIKKTTLSCIVSLWIVSVKVVEHGLALFECSLHAIVDLLLLVGGMLTRIGANACSFLLLLVVRSLFFLGLLFLLFLLGLRWLLDSMTVKQIIEFFGEGIVVVHEDELGSTHLKLRLVQCLALRLLLRWSL